MEVKQQHMEQAVRMSAAFKTYMENFKGSAARRVLVDGARMDESVKELELAKKRTLDDALKQTR
jgi:hypothetical protein